MTLHGDFIYVARDGLQVLDASDPGNLPEVGSFIDRAGTGQAIAGEGDRIYVAQRSVRQPMYPTDLWVFDVGDPRSPRRIAVHQVIPSATDMVVNAGRVYVALGDAQPYGVWVYDVRDPARVALAGNINTIGRPRHLAVAAGRLYIVEEGTEDPYRGTLSGRHGVQVVDLRADAWHQALFVPFPEPIGGIAVRGDRCYIAARGQGLFAVDVDRAASSPIARGTPAGGNDGTVGPAR